MTPWTVARQAPLSMEFSRQEYRSGLLPSARDLPDPGIKPESPALAYRFFKADPPGTSLTCRECTKKEEEEEKKPD